MGGNSNTMYAYMLIQTDSKVPVSKKSSIPVDDMNIVVPVWRFKIESHSD